MTGNWCSRVSEGVHRVSVQIMPNGKSNQVIGVLGNALKIRLQAQPIEGRANEALVRFLAKALDIPQNAIYITHGHTNKRKLIEVRNSQLTVENMTQRLINPCG